MTVQLAEVFRRVVHDKGFIYVSLGTLMNTAFAGVFWFILAALLSVGEYGFINYVLAISNVGASVSILGLKTTIVTYYPREKELGVIKQAYFITFTAGLTSLIVLTVLGHFIAGLLVVVEAAFGMFLGGLLAKREYKKYAIMSSFNRVVQIGVSLLMYYMFGLTGIFAGYILVFFLFSAEYFKSLLKPDASFNKLKNKFSFTVYSYAHDITGVLAGYFDKIIVGFVSGLMVLGVYHLAFQVYWILAVLPAALLNYLLPERSGGVFKREVEVIGVLLAMSLSLLAVILAPIIVPVLFPNFTDSVILIQVMSFGLIPSTITSIRKAKVFSEERPLSALTANVVGVVVEIGGLLLLPYLLGEVGLAVAIVLGQSAIMIVLEAINRRSKNKIRKPV